MGRARLLERTGLASREARAWASYDWANSALFTIVITAIFPVYYAQVVAGDMPEEDAKSLFLYATTASLGLSALLAPILGAHADVRGRRKTLLAAAMAVGALATAALFLFDAGEVWPALVAFGLANLGATLSIVFYDSLLPFVARGAEDDVDRLSTAAYGLGYFGGGIALVLAALIVSKPAVFGLPSEGTLAVRTTFLVAACWWLVFSVPILRGVPEPPPMATAGERRGVLAQLASTFGELRRYPQALLVLGAFLVYNDGVVTIIRMATIFAEQRGFESTFILGVIVAVQFVALPAAFAYGQLARRIGARPAILIGIACYGGITLVAAFMRTEAHFVALAMAVALVQGGVQALSRSLFASLIPPARSAEFFGLFGVAEKFAAIAGPLVLGLVIDATGDSPLAVLCLLPFFAVGAAILSRVDVDAGRAAARGAPDPSRA